LRFIESFSPVRELEVGGGDLLAGSHGGRGADDLLQLPHVAGPRVRDQPLDGRAGELRDGLPGRRGELFEEMLGEWYHVIDTLPERGRVDLEPSNSVVEVLAEVSVLHRLSEVL